MTDYVTPCAKPENDPDDWFIEKDGRQYPDDVLVSQDQRNLIVSALEDVLDREPTAEEIDDAVDAAEDAHVKRALLRRRHAKDKCHVDCYIRTKCLGFAIEERPLYGIFGGYYPEELRVITKELDARNRRRSQDADVDVPE